MKDNRKFRNLKTQCYYLDGEIKVQFISPKVANKMYETKMTVSQRLLHERKAIKKKERMDKEALPLISKKYEREVPSRRLS